MAWESDNSDDNAKRSFGTFIGVFDDIHERPKAT
jgi:hypothetical protein